MILASENAFLHGYKLKFVFIIKSIINLGKKFLNVRYRDNGYR